MKNSERRARATLIVDVLMMAEAVGQWRSGRSDSDGHLQTGRRRGQNSVVGTPARSPDSAFNAMEPRGAWQPRGNGVLPGGSGAVLGV
jgi:hypothetical protein